MSAGSGPADTSPERRDGRYASSQSCWRRRRRRGSMRRWRGGRSCSSIMPTARRRRLPRRWRSFLRIRRIRSWGWRCRGLAREELRHFEQVQSAMTDLGVAFIRQKPGRYAAGLRRELRTSEPGRKLDLLLSGALIEARSCERFRLLAERLPEPLGRFYGRLAESEARHFELYVGLARERAPGGVGGAVGGVGQDGGGVGYCAGWGVAVSFGAAGANSGEAQPRSKKALSGGRREYGCARLRCARRAAQSL